MSVSHPLASSSQTLRPSFKPSFKWLLFNRPSFKWPIVLSLATHSAIYLTSFLCPHPVTAQMTLPPPPPLPDPAYGSPVQPPQAYPSNPYPSNPYPSNPYPSNPYPSNPYPNQPYERPPSLPQERVFNAPTTNYPLSPQATQYRVYVANDNPAALQQIQTIAPGAFFQVVGGRRVIQAGVFGSEANARQQVALLAAQGIQAQIATPTGTVSQNPVTTPITLPGTASATPDGTHGSGLAGSQPFGSRSQGFYVVMPARGANLTAGRDRAVQFGIPLSLMQVRNRPLGPHLAIGPLDNLQQAEMLREYLYSNGLADARIYYAK